MTNGSNYGIYRARALTKISSYLLLAIADPQIFFRRGGKRYDPLNVAPKDKNSAKSTTKKKGCINKDVKKKFVCSLGSYSENNAKQSLSA